MKIIELLIWTFIPMIPLMIMIYFLDPKEDGSGFGFLGYELFKLMDKLKWREK